MKTLVAFLSLIAISLAFDCFGRNNTCSNSHMKCDTGYEGFCEHAPGPVPIGCCSCDKECESDADCTNEGATGCPPRIVARCDTFHHVCHCGPRRNNRT